MKKTPNDQCSICNELYGNEVDKLYSGVMQQLSDNFGIKDRVLYEDESFVVIPTLGPVTACHLLLLPKAHVSAFALLEKEQLNKAEELIHGIRRIIEQRYGKSIVFEHGTLDNGIPGSASCNHAHMHILSCNQSIYSLLQKDGLQLRNIKKLEQLSQQRVRGVPYFYYCENKEDAYIMDDVIQKSQYMRILVAEVMNTPEKGNWKTNWGISEVAEMIFTIRNDLENLRET